MANAKRPSETQNSTRIRWTIAIISSFCGILFAFFTIKSDSKPAHLNEKKTVPFIKLVNENSDTNNRNYEAFFLPTKYNFALKVRPPKADSNNKEKVTPAKPIFSQLDRLRILRTFTNRFTESEYWTVSRIQMHPHNKMFTTKKEFIEKLPESSFKKVEMLEKFYNISTEFLFSERDINEHSR